MKTVIHVSSGERRAARACGEALNPQPSTLNRLHAFTLVEILVTVVLLALIVLALMAVFNSTQAAFRASLTQADVLEGGRSVMGLIKTDLESMTPSFGRSNVVLNGGYYGYIPSDAPVNFCVLTNIYQYRSNSLPLLQMLTGTDNPVTRRTNVLQKFFILTRQNTTWTGIGYVVDTTSTNYFNPLYRFVMTTNLNAPRAPWVLYATFLTNSVLPVSPTNSRLSRLQNGIVHLTVRAYDPDGYWMTNTVVTNVYAAYFRTNRNIRFHTPAWGEVSCYLFSNTLPASVAVELGVLEDRAIQRAESLAASPTAQMTYLSNHVGQVHLFRQRIPIRNVDPSAWQ